MKPALACLILSLSLMMSGCTPLSSFYPLWDNEHDGFEPLLAGNWRSEPDDDSILSVSETPEMAYVITIREPDHTTGREKQSRYNARMVRLGERLFLDFELDEESLSKTLDSEVFPPIVPVHFFGRVKLEGDSLNIALLDDEQFQNNVAGKYPDLPLLKRDGDILLVADTKTIQRILASVAEDSELWGDGMDFRRIYPR
jgi:hypothetical protein